MMTMKVVYKHVHEGIYFSHNGHAAYLKGEKPFFMWPKDAQIEATCQHHIGHWRGQTHTRELVMFYREKDKGPEISLKPLFP
jgi:hypothetical protein